MEGNGEHLLGSMALGGLLQSRPSCPRWVQAPVTP